MTSKERMHRALAGDIVDRIPIALIQDETYLCRATGADVREMLYGNSSDRVRLQSLLMERHPYNDVLICWDGTARQPASELHRDGDTFFSIDFKTGSRTEIPNPKDKKLPEGPVTSEIAAEDPITSIHEIDDRLGPICTADEIVEAGWFDVVAPLVREFGGTKFVMYRPGELFPPAIEYLGGFERAMETVVTDPDLIRAVVLALARRKLPYIEASSSFKPDGVLLTAYLEGTDMIAPQAWRDLVAPGHRLMVEAAKRFGQKILLWFLGGCMELLEDFVDLDVDALVVETSRCGYTCDPGEIKSIIGDRMCVFGWTPEYAMVSDNREEISTVVEAQIRDAGGNGGFVMGTTFLTADTAPETVDFFCDEVVRLSAENLPLARETTT